MTNHRLFRIGFQLPTSMKEKLLTTFPPRFEHVWGDSVTCAYKVTEEFRYAAGSLTAAVYGLTRRDDNEALLLLIGSERFRTDGIRYHITLSTKAGIARAEAGKNIQRKEIIYLPFDQTQIKFTMAWERLPLWKTSPTIQVARAA